MSGVPIRSCVSSDLLAILEIERAQPFAAHWSEAEYAKLWSGSDASRAGFVATEEGHILGFVVAREVAGEWELENLAVAAQRQGRGIGSALLQALVEWVRKSGGTTLLLEVRESNTAARKLYERQGLQAYGRRKNYYQSPAEDAFLYKKIFPDLSMKIR